MEVFLLLGFFVGMSHALEADHLAAVAALSSRGGSRRGLALRGAAWGLGHTLTLFAVCSAVILFSFALTPERAAALEFAVGAMLVLLALDVLRRMRARKIHFHAHAHEDRGQHLHAHSHATAQVAHDRDPHAHAHQRFPVRALLVGLVHGAAGSAGLIALTLAATQEPWMALGYVALFGVGSMAGMAALSWAAAWPLGAFERAATWLHSGLQVAVAAFAGIIGVKVMAETWELAGGIF